jgi:hypothetical protein
LQKLVALPSLGSPLVNSHSTNKNMPLLCNAAQKHRRETESGKKTRAAYIIKHGKKMRAGQKRCRQWEGGKKTSAEAKERHNIKQRQLRREMCHVHILASNQTAGQVAKMLLHQQVEKIGNVSLVH